MIKTIVFYISSKYAFRAVKAIFYAYLFNHTVKRLHFAHTLYAYVIFAQKITINNLKISSHSEPRIFPKNALNSNFPVAFWVNKLLSFFVEKSDMSFTEDFLDALLFFVCEVHSKFKRILNGKKPQVFFVLFSTDVLIHPTTPTNKQL